MDLLNLGTDLTGAHGQARAQANPVNPESSDPMSAVQTTTVTIGNGPASAVWPVPSAKHQCHPCVIPAKT